MNGEGEHFGDNAGCDGYLRGAHTVVRSEGVIVEHQARVVHPRADASLRKFGYESVAAHPCILRDSNGELVPHVASALELAGDYHARNVSQAFGEPSGVALPGFDR
jgi:hypothetical protein